MNKPTLVIMAAGMGSRFGGLKQMTPVDEQGHFMMDFSIFDAIRAGFGKVVCVIKEEMEQAFEEIIGTRIRPHIELVYAHQKLTDIPDGFSIPEGRTKPWGTGHATMAAIPYIDSPFAVLNADDFYGKEAFEVMAKFLSADRKPTEHAMVGYALENTLTENGSVSRGVCSVDESNHLTGVVECLKIVRHEDGTMADQTEDGEVPLEAGTTVSLNFWGFQKEALPELERLFVKFLSETVPQNPLKAEFYLPGIADTLIREGKGSVEVLQCPAHWYGVTYQEDLPGVKASIAKLKADGQYPTELWK